MATSGGRGPRFGQDSIVETNEVRDLRRRVAEMEQKLAVLLKGRRGGQTINGGTQAGENLTLRSTSNTTRGYIILLDAAGIGGAPTSGLGLDVVGAAFPGIALRSTGTGAVTLRLFAFDAGPGAYIGTQSNHNLTLRTNDVDRVILNTSGNMGIGGAPAASARLDIQSTTGALIVPRMTTAQKNALTAVDGMIVYDTTLGKFQNYKAGAWTNLI